MHTIYTEKMEMVDISFDPFRRKWTVEQDDDEEGEGEEKGGGEGEEEGEEGRERKRKGTSE